MTKEQREKLLNQSLLDIQSIPFLTEIEKTRLRKVIETMRASDDLEYIKDKGDTNRKNPNSLNRSLTVVCKDDKLFIIKPDKERQDRGKSNKASSCRVRTYSGEAGHHQDETLIMRHNRSSNKAEDSNAVIIDFHSSVLMKDFGMDYFNFCYSSISYNVIDWNDIWYLGRKMGPFRYSW